MILVVISVINCKMGTEKKTRKTGNNSLKYCLKLLVDSESIITASLCRCEFPNLQKKTWMHLSNKLSFLNANVPT